MRLTGLAAVIALAIVAPSLAGTIDVAHLDTANFEHDTQAATGATTGDWLVKFYSPKCTKCDQITEPWGDLAVSLKERLTVAEVDCAESEELCKRLDITATPSVVLFRKGKMYSMQGAGDMAAWTEFVEDGYKTSPSKPVPKPLTAVEKLTQRLLQLELKEKAGLGAVVGVVLLGLMLTFNKSPNPGKGKAA
eukprot:TRINITY_DN28328_c0_g1_i2.p2 TRINITY_DN28328_c0_g1~~TRINITY_DN28328_c0_g1_i2.p2  ORF type:complete len:192 (+),score=59.04 TRINITY_DN28328_c0_g1_i2:112-687(+)